MISALKLFFHCRVFISLRSLSFSSHCLDSLSLLLWSLCTFAPFFSDTNSFSRLLIALTPYIATYTLPYIINNFLHSSPTCDSFFNSTLSKSQYPPFARDTALVWAASSTCWWLFKPMSITLSLGKRWSGNLLKKTMNMEHLCMLWKVRYWSRWWMNHFAKKELFHLIWLMTSRPNSDQEPFSLHPEMVIFI